MHSKLRARGGNALKQGVYAHVLHASRSRTLLGLMIVFSLTACGGTEPPPSGPGVAPSPSDPLIPDEPLPPPLEAIVPETTKVADAATRDALRAFDPDTGKLRFAGITPLLATLEAGDVLVSEPSPSAPYGYLRKVETLREQGEGLVIETSQAALTDAIEQGSLDVRGELEPDDLVSTQTYMSGVVVRALEQDAPGELSAQAGTVLSEGYDFEVGIDVVLNLDGEVGGAKGSGEVRVKGLVRFNAGYGIGFGIEPCLELPPVCMDRFEAKIGVQQYAELKTSAKLEGRIAKEIVLATNYFTPYVFFIGPVPVVIVPKIDIVIGANGEAKAVFNFETRESAQWLVGAKWTDPDDDGKGWEDLSDRNGFQWDMPTPTFEATMRLRAYGKSDMKLLFYGIAGPAVDLRLGAGLDIQVPRRPLWRIFGHLRAGFSFQLDIASIIKLNPYEKTLFELEPDLIAAPNYAPRFSNVNTDPISVNLGQAVTLGPRAGFSGYFDVMDPEGDPIRFSAYSDKDGNIPMTVTFASAGPRTVTVTAQDDRGASSSTTLRLNVVNDPPIIQTTVTSTSVPVGVDYFIGARAFDLNSGNLTCDRLSWSVSAPDTVTPLGTSGTGCEAVAKFATEGARTLTVTATDPQGGSASKTLDVTVTPPPVNAAPVISSISITDKNGLEVPEGGLLYNGQDGDYYPPLTLAVSASDPESSPLTVTWSCVTGTYNAPVTDNGNGTFSCEPAYSHRVPIVVSVTVTDGETPVERGRSFYMLEFIR